MKRITPGEIAASYDVILLDAFGVLVNRFGAYPGVAQFLAGLDAARKPYLVLTNGAGRLPGSSAAFYKDFGLDIPLEKIITSGMMLGPYFEKSGLRGQRCFVLGTQDSREYVKLAGGVVCGNPETDGGAGSIDAVVLCDESGYPLREMIDLALNIIGARLDAGKEIRLVLPNPDTFYNIDKTRVGFTAGAIASLIESVIKARYTGHALRFEALGKPGPWMFDEAKKRFPSARFLMIGDQLETDILGANKAGIASTLICDNPGPALTLTAGDPLRPSFWMPSFAAVP